MYRWTEESRAWLDRAVEWTGYADAVEALITPHLWPGGTVCDLGCGTGWFSIRLHRHGWSVTAVDRDPEGPVRAAEEPGLDVRICSWHDLTGETWDSVVMLLAGKPDLELPDYLALARHRLILLTRGRRKSHVGRSEQETSADFLAPDETSERLRRLGAAVTQQDVTLEFGQPFRDLVEAGRYADAWHGDREEVRRRLQETGDPDFPLYLPNAKSLSLITAEKERPQAGSYAACQ